MRITDISSGLRRSLLSVFLASLFTGCATQSQPLASRAGTTEFGRHQYTEYLPGDLPVIIAAPHGGREKPADIPDRTEGTFAFDTNTQELARAIREAFYERTGQRPHVIICRLHRRKVDCNREVKEAAAGHPLATMAWEDFQGFIEQSRAEVVKQFGRGLFIDLHGHGHKEQRLELGYLHTRERLGLPDAGLSTPAVATESSLRGLAAISPKPYAELLRGSGSLGALLETEGFAATPSPREPQPSAPYFNGGYNTRRHARDGGPVFGLQIESNSKGVRDTAESRERFAAALVTSVLTFLKEHAALDLGK